MTDFFYYYTPLCPYVYNCGLGCVITIKFDFFRYLVDMDFTLLILYFKHINQTHEN